MADIMSAYHGARRALFRAYHIGGCSSCAFRPDETLAEVCARQDPKVNPQEAIDAVLRGHEEDQKLLLPPNELKTWLDQKRPLMLVDVRSRQEFEAVSIPGSILLTPEISSMLAANDGGTVVMIDHAGNHVLDSVSYFIGHGKKDIYGLAGGIDAWAEKIDPQMPRYELE